MRQKKPSAALAGHRRPCPLACTDKAFRLLARIKDMLMLEHEEGEQ
jgi:hypothetical protein